MEENPAGADQPSVYQVPCLPSSPPHRWHACQRECGLAACHLAAPARHCRHIGALLEQRGALCGAAGGRTYFAGALQGSSPDEVALVDGARQLGFEFVGINGADYTVSFQGTQAVFQARLPSLHLPCCDMSAAEARHHSRAVAPPPTAGAAWLPLQGQLRCGATACVTSKPPAEPWHETGSVCRCCKCWSSAATGAA